LLWHRCVARLRRRILVPHVLVIGTEPEIWEVTRSALAQEGYRLGRVASLDAVNRVQQDRPDLAIVDSALRRMSAVEIATEARPALYGFACLRKPFADANCWCGAASSSPRRGTAATCCAPP
jgi:response regulator RpfG family c-di-GMP phosphodiesterase